jgi:hypothetical protein
MRRLLLLSMIWVAPAAAQQVTPPAAGGPPPGRVEAIGRDAGPASQPPRTDSEDAVNRGTDGSAVGLGEPAATGTTPQGFLGDATAGSTAPAAPVGGAPEPSRPPR